MQINKLYAAPGQPGSIVELKERYGNFIGGKFIPPLKGRYMQDISPTTGKPFCEVAKSTPEDVELALDAAHAAKEKWGEILPLSERAKVLNKIADAIEANEEMLAVAESWENVLMVDLDSSTSLSFAFPLACISDVRNSPYPYLFDASSLSLLSGIFCDAMASHIIIPEAIPSWSGPLRLPVQ